MIIKLVGLLVSTQVASAIQATTDIYYHEQTTHLPEAMWAFSTEGLKILSIDGSEVLRTLSATELDCGDSCYYFDVVTDGRKHVWANALHASPHRVDVFSLQTGDYLGGVATCNTPLDMDYVTNRDELWIRCAEPADLDDPESGHLSVIQAGALGASSEQVRLTDDRAYGYSVFHSSLGNYGYATANNVNLIFKIDMANRVSVANFTLDKLYSSYDVTYSKVNRHLYLRSRVCCTCGFDGADAATCGRGPGRPGQNIQTGPSAGRMDLNGTCGLTCEGSAADTVGVLEFDTVSESFVGSHTPKIGFGATPEASPDGKHVVLFANDGGQNIRVLRAGTNGQASTVAFDVSVNFANVPPGREAVSDFAFVKWKSHDLLVLASGYDNDVALIDLSDSPPSVTKVSLSNSASQTGGNGGRMVEWAYDSDYIWIDASGSEEMYVIKLGDDGVVANTAVVRTLSDITPSKLIYVEDFALRAENSIMNQASLLESDESDNGDPSTVAVVGLTVGLASLLMNVVLMVVLAGNNTSVGRKNSGQGEKQQQPENSPNNYMEDDKTLGSKAVL